MYINFVVYFQEDEEPFSVFTIYRFNYAQNEQIAREAPRKIQRRKFPAPDTTLTGVISLSNVFF